MQIFNFQLNVQFHFYLLIYKPQLSVTNDTYINFLPWVVNFTVIYFHIEVHIFNVYFAVQIS